MGDCEVILKNLEKARDDVLLKIQKEHEESLKLITMTKGSSERRALESSNTEIRTSRIDRIQLFYESSVRLTKMSCR